MKGARIVSRLLASSSTRVPETPLFSALRRGAAIDVHPEVQEALACNKPIVALETAITTHGLPYPTNRETALSLERIVRATGSVPATIGFIAGRAKIGLEYHDLERLADPARNSSAVKISRRDIAAAATLKRDGGTTISSTLIFAALAGIKVVATGGLGGVHRGGENSLDISADLPELSRCPVALVSTGVKSILDIGRTLEYLETLGVPVVSFSTTSDFPAFYYPKSGLQSPWRVNDPETAAQIMFTQWQFGMRNGVVFAVPIPEEYEALGQFLKSKVDQAIRESEANGLNQMGNKATPWLLSRIAELSDGKSIESNIALIENTALIGARIAIAYSQLVNCQANREDESIAKMTPSLKPTLASDGESESLKKKSPAKVLVLGSAAVDISAKAHSTAEAHSSGHLHTTLPGTVEISPGGVGRNIAEACHRILSSRDSSSRDATMLVSPIGADIFGRLLRDETQRLGMRTDGLICGINRSAVCSILLDDVGNLVGGVADMDISHSMDGDAAIRHMNLQRPSIVAFDGNLSPDTIKAVVMYCNAHNIQTFFEPTSVPKSIAIFPAIAASLDESNKSNSSVTATSPNILELTQMYNAASCELTSHPLWWEVIDAFSLGPNFRTDLEHLARRNATDQESTRGTLAFLIDKGVAQMAVNLLPFFQNIIVKCGPFGVIAVLRIPGPARERSGWSQRHTNIAARCIIGHGKSSQETVVLQHFPPHVLTRTLSVTGAGDSLVGSLLASMLEKPMAFQDPQAMSDAISSAQYAAILALQSRHAVSPRLSSKDKIS